MLQSAVIGVAMLAWGQASIVAPASSDTAEPTNFFLPESAWPQASGVQPVLFPDFSLPQPTTPPPPPALAAEEIGLPGTRVTAAWLAGNATHGFGMTDFDCNHTWLLGYDDFPPLSITPGVGLHLWSGPAQLNLPARVYDAYLDVNWRPVDRESWGLSAGITPGLYGDFQNLGGRTFQITGWLLGNLHFGPHWNLLGGIAYVRQLRSHLLPVGGLVWSPSDDWQLELVVPKPRLVHRYRYDEFGASYWCVAGQLGGGAWAVADTTTTNVLLSYSDLRLLAGLEFFGKRGRAWNLEGGYVFARRLSIDQQAPQAIANSVVLQASIGF